MTLWCSERMGSNYNEGMTADEFEEFWGNPSNGDYDHEHVIEVERMVAEENLLAENKRLRNENASLREELERIEDEL